MMKWQTVGLLLTLALTAGCGGQAGPETIPVTGSITMAGQPVPEAVVVFTPKNSDDPSVLAAQAETDADGRFQMRTYLGEDDYKAGIQPGEYAVTVTKLEVVQDMTRQPKHLLPKKFSLPNSTPLSATVTAGGENQFDFALD